MIEFLEGIFTTIGELRNGDFLDIIMAYSLLLGLLVAVPLLVTVILWLVLGRVSEEIMWLIERKRCRHCHEWTAEVSKGDFPTECKAGVPCCESCGYKHFINDSNKLDVCCPMCRTRLEYVEAYGLSNVGCPRGHGMWLDHSQMTILSRGDSSLTATTAHHR